MACVRVYGCFDLRYDADLLARLVRESHNSDSPFEVAAWSTHHTDSLAWQASLRRTLATVDEVIVLCGEHTDSAEEMSAELQIVREEVKPYFLLWGRRGSSCTKPSTAKHADSFYTWIWEVLKSQIDIATRRPIGESIPTR